MKKIPSNIEKKIFGDVFNRKKVLNKLMKNKKNKIIFDVGANVGQSVFDFFESLNSIKKIHCFEPNQLLSDIFIKNTQKYKKKLILNNNALGPLNKKIQFFLNEYSTLSSFYKIPKNSKFFINKTKLNNYFLGQKKIYVNQIRIDDYVNKNNIPKIDILKIDTQGYDIEVLKGAISTIKKNKIDIIISELLFNFGLYKIKNSFKEIEDILADQYLLWDISFLYKNPKFHCLDYVDAIYVNKKFLKLNKFI